MNNLLCAILLFSVTTLNLVDADCLNYPDVPNGSFDKDSHCVDVEMTCNEGYEMIQMAKCVGDVWQYQDPFCKPPVCDYNITNSTYLYAAPIYNEVNGNDGDCSDLCANNYTECTAYFVNTRNKCLLHKSPVIAIIGEVPDLNKCFEKCSTKKECKMLGYESPSQVCTLLSDTDLPTGYKLRPNDEDSTVAKKISCQ